MFFYCISASKDDSAFVQLHGPKRYTETDMTEDFEDAVLSITRYSLVRVNSHCKITGGVRIYLKKEIKFSEMKRLISQRNISYLQLQITVSNYNSVMGVTYHFPNSSHNNFLNFFDEVSGNIINGNRDLVRRYALFC